MDYYSPIEKKALLTILNSLDESPKNYTGWKVNPKRSHILWSHLCNTLKMTTIIELQIKDVGWKGGFSGCSYKRASWRTTVVMELSCILTISASVSGCNTVPQFYKMFLPKGIGYTGSLWIIFITWIYNYLNIKINLIKKTES